MAVTVVDDLVTITAADSTAGWANDGMVIRQLALESVILVEGAGSILSRRSAAGIGWISFDTGAANVDITDQHYFDWARDLDFVESRVNGGWRLRVSSGADVSANFGGWYVAGEDTARYRIKGFNRFCADPFQPFDETAGTPPALTAVRSFGTAINAITFSSRTTYFNDSLERGTGLTITGGTAAPRGSPEVAVLAEGEGRGLFKNINGAFYILGRVTVGDIVALANSTFEDSNEVWVFEDQNVSASFHKLEFVGGTGVNRATFGTKIGTGITAEGSGGNTFKAGGVVPFRIEAIDPDIAAQLYGCNLTGPVALKADALRAFLVEDNSLASFTDDTRDANDPGANDAPVFPAADAINDSGNFGHAEPFNSLSINVGTAGVGTYTVTWEYWNGTAWTALIQVTDGTGNFKTAGTSTVDYAVPGDWAATTLGGRGPFYYIRARRDGGTSTTNPVMTQVQALMGGRVRWEQVNAEAITGTWTNMDTIRVRNGTILRKVNLVDNVAGAKSAALDFGATDPALDTVREITIIGGANGVLLEPTVNTTYNFRNIKFSGLTKKVRIVAPLGRLVTINILDGGDGIANPADLDLVGGIVSGDVTINNAPVTLLVNVDDNNGVNLQNAQVLAEAGDGTGDLPFEETVTITRAATTATVTHTGHGLATSDKVTIRGAEQPEYNAVHTIIVTGTNAYTYTVSGSPATPATGTITSTGVWLAGLTDVNGQISAAKSISLNQSIRGPVRKSTTSPRFKSFSLAGNVVDKTAGLTITVRMILDE